MGIKSLRLILNGLEAPGERHGPVQRGDDVLPIRQLPAEMHAALGRSHPSLGTVRLLGR